jgi:hypothetical protein
MISPVKILFILLATAITAHATTTDPGKAALEFLEKVRSGKINLAPNTDTAISPQTTDGKKHEIAKRLERLARDIGSDSLEIGTIKTDENFAAVMIRKVGGYDPSRLQVFPVALIRRDADWTAAPMPASFENARAGHAIALRNRTAQLEDWMLRQQVIDLENLRAQSGALMRKKIETSLSTKDLRALTANQAGMRFLSACQNRDLPAILGLLGGLSNKLPDDWPLRLKATENAILPNAKPSDPWRRLIDPKVLRAVVHQEEDETGGLISIACLDPARPSRPSISLVHLSISKNPEGNWEIDLPDSLLLNNPTDEESFDDDLDDNLLDAFPTEWRKIEPATPLPSATTAHDALLAALRSSSPAALLRLTHLGTDPTAARKACIAAANLWWTLHDPTAVRHAMPLTLKESDETALGLFQIFSTRSPDRLNLKTLYLEKTTQGWLWHPTPTPAAIEHFKNLPELNPNHWTTKWQKLLLSDSIEITKIPIAPPPTPTDAQNVMLAWLKATRSGDVKAALKLTARLHDPKGDATPLQNLGHEITTARRSTAEPTIIGTYPGNSLTAIGLKISQAGTTSHPLYSVIQTPVGARILIEIDLFAARGREFLNNIAFNRIEKLGSPAAAADLRARHTEFQTNVESLKQPEN